MKYNHLGKTGMVVSEIGLGGSAFSDAYQDQGFNDESGVEIVKKAVLEYGINYIDVAPWYGHTRAESVIGQALPQIDRNRYYISTKVGRYLPDVCKMFDFSAEKTVQSVHESLKRLNIEYLDIAFVHDVEFASSPDIIINETLPALQKLKESGQIRFIGITGYELDSLKYIIENSLINIDVVLSYCRGTLFNNDLKSYMPFFEKRNIGVINGSVLGMGLLTELGPSNWHPANKIEDFKNACTSAVQYCKSNEIDIAKLAFNFVTHQSGVSSNLFSAGKIEYLGQNVSYIQEGLSNKEQNCLKEIIDNYFKPLKQTNWEGVEVEKYWRKYNAAIKTT